MQPRSGASASMQRLYCVAVLTSRFSVAGGSWRPPGGPAWVRVEYFVIQGAKPWMVPMSPPARSLAEARMLRSVRASVPGGGRGRRPEARRPRRRGRGRSRGARPGSRGWRAGSRGAGPSIRRGTRSRGSSRARWDRSGRCRGRGAAPTRRRRTSRSPSTAAVPGMVPARVKSGVPSRCTSERTGQIARAREHDERRKSDPGVRSYRIAPGPRHRRRWRDVEVAGTLGSQITAPAMLAWKVRTRSSMLLLFGEPGAVERFPGSGARRASSRRPRG